MNDLENTILDILNTSHVPAPSATLEIDQRVSAARVSGKEIFHFGFGGSPFPIPENIRLALVAHAAERTYLPAAGLLELRKAIASYLRERFAIDAHHDRTIVGPGSKMLLYLLMQVSKGSVLLPRPSWVSYAPQNKMTGHRTIWCDTMASDGHLITADGLRKKLKEMKEAPAFLLINYPNNPTGCTYSRRSLEELARVADDSGLMIISDEIYAELDHSGGHTSLASIYPEGTILSSGISKCYGAGGWRLGYMHLSQHANGLLKAMLASATETYSCVSAPVQFAAVEAFRDHQQYGEMLKKARTVLSRAADHFIQQMTPFGARIAPAAGAFYVMMDLQELSSRFHANGIADDVELCERLFNECSTAFLPGSAFGMPRDQFCLRVALTDFDGAALLEMSIEELSRTSIEKLAPRIHEGTARTASFLSRIKTTNT